MLSRTKNLLDYDRYLKLILINMRKNKRYLMELKLTLRKQMEVEKHMI